MATSVFYIKFHIDSWLQVFLDYIPHGFMATSVFYIKFHIDSWLQVFLD
jgi:hypothetical protein